MAKTPVLGYSGLWGDDAIRAYQETLHEEPQANQPSRTYHSSNAGKARSLSQALYRALHQLGLFPISYPRIRRYQQRQQQSSRRINDLLINEHLWPEVVGPSWRAKLYCTIEFWWCRLLTLLSNWSLVECSTSLSLLMIYLTYESKIGYSQ